MYFYYHSPPVSYLAQREEGGLVHPEVGREKPIVRLLCQPACSNHCNTPGRRLWCASRTTAWRAFRLTRRPKLCVYGLARIQAARDPSGACLQAD